MAIQLDLISVVIPIQNIKKYCTTKTFDEWIEEEKQSIGKTIWYDEHLYREGAMNWMDIEMILKRWERRGLQLFMPDTEEKEWHHLCVVDGVGGLGIPCSWIAFDKEKGCAWLKGTEIGEIIGCEDSF